MNTLIKYPALEEEENIVMQTTTNADTDVRPVLDGAALLAHQHVVRGIPVSRHVTGYAVDIARATRPNEPGVPAFVTEQVGWGAGPRASQALILAAKCHAALQGRLNVSCEDVRTVALPVLRHRIQASFTAEAEGITTDSIVQRLLQDVRERTAS